MFDFPGWRTCMAPLQPDDGHDLCPSCLGLNCGIMPRAVRAARLAEAETPDGCGRPPSFRPVESNPAYPFQAQGHRNRRGSLQEG
ncbi:hypothetical protein VZT92_026472 [Zoarces viviparus]|uniref:Uncharacterized protein n=1 Tax=Zoarces viviparus TaxID=48416 RepID=A0AAW1E0H5_ZOAVI